MNDPKPVTTPAAAPKAAVAAKKPRKSILQIVFNEGMRDVEVTIVQDEDTMTPRKIEHALNLAMRKYREHNGQKQAAAARAQRALDEKAAAQK